MLPGSDSSDSKSLHSLAGAKLLKNLYILVRILCSYRSLVGNQFIFLNSAAPIWSRFSMPRQNLIHLFCPACSFFLSFLFKFVYQARFAKSKWGCISALHRSLLKDGLRKLCFRYRNFSLPFIFSYNLQCHRSP